MHIEGIWQGWPTQPRTMVNVRLDVNDIGKFLVRMGQPEGVRRGTAKLEGPLAWNGNPSELDYATLSGNFVLEANKGQFIKLDPGIGKLLGVLSLQSLPRRLSLDFRDIFSEGLAFDEIRRYRESQPRHCQHRELPHPGARRAHPDDWRRRSRARNAEIARKECFRA